MQSGIYTNKISAYIKLIHDRLLQHSEPIRKQGFSVSRLQRELNFLSRELENVALKPHSKYRRFPFDVIGEDISRDERKALERLNEICNIVNIVSPSPYLPLFFTETELAKKAEHKKLKDRINYIIYQINNDHGKKAFAKLMKQPYRDKILLDEKESMLGEKLISHFNQFNSGLALAFVIENFDLDYSFLVSLLNDNNKLVAINNLMILAKNSSRMLVLLQKIIESEEFANHIFTLQEKQLLNEHTLLLLTFDTLYFAEALSHTHTNDKETLIEEWKRLTEKSTKEDKAICEAIMTLYKHDALTAESLALLRHNEPAILQRNVMNPREAAYRFAINIIQKEKEREEKHEASSVSNDYSPILSSLVVGTPSPDATATIPPGFSRKISVSESDDIHYPPLEKKSSVSSLVVKHSLSAFTPKDLSSVMAEHCAQPSVKIITKQQFEDALAKYKSRWNRNMTQSNETEILIGNLTRYFKLKDVYVCTKTQREYLKPKLRFNFLGKHLNFFNNKQAAFSQALVSEIQPAVLKP